MSSTLDHDDDTALRVCVLEPGHSGFLGLLHHHVYYIHLIHCIECHENICTVCVELMMVGVILLLATHGVGKAYTICIVQQLGV